MRPVDNRTGKRNQPAYAGRSPSILAISLLACLTFASSSLAQSRSGVVVPVSGERYTARLSSIDATGNFTFERDGKEQSLALKDLVSFGAYSDGDKGPRVVLADGGSLAVASLDKLTGQALFVTCDLWGEVRLPLGGVRGIVFRPPADPLARDKLFERVLSAKGDEDQLLLDNGDLASGQLKSPAEVLGPAPPGEEEPAEGLKSLRLETKAGPVSVAVEKLLALMFNPALVEAPRERAPPTWLGFKDGSRLSATKVAAVDGKLKLSLAGGLALSADADSVVEDLFYAQPLAAGVTYLSDLKPTGYKHIAFLDLGWNFGSDKNLHGGRLRSGGNVYAKGLSMHSTARLAYRLDGRFEKFQADLALDDQAGTRGSVIYRVYVEREAGQWQTAYDSPIIRGGDAPVPLSIDVRGAARLALIVEFADRGDERDYANWLDARLVK